LVKFKVGIIGAGGIVKAAHLPAFKAVPQVEVVGIADLNKPEALKLAKSFGISHVTDNYLDLTNDTSIDIIDVCTPVQVRLDVIKAAAENGKNILVEKPLAISLKEAEAIYEVVKKNGVKLNVIQNYRYFPCANKVRERVAKGYLGNVLSIQSSGLTPHPAESTKASWLYHYGGVLYDFSPHLVDLLLWINQSPVIRVTAFGGDFTKGKMGHINYAQILIEFKNGSTAVVDVSWLTATLGMRFTVNIHGSGGHILMDVRNNSFLEYHGLLTPLDEFTYSSKKLLSFIKVVLNGQYFKGAAAFHKLIVDDFLQSIQNSRESLVPVEQGVMVNAVLEAAMISIKTGKTVNLEETFQSKQIYEEIIKKLYLNTKK
jgi:UDP-N-acetylglucosamine 3-dehydrogenase